MGKILGLLLIVFICLYVCHKRTGGAGVGNPALTGPGSVTSGAGEGTGGSPGPSNAQPKFKTFIDAACAKQNLKLVNYSENGNVVDFTVRGRDFNAVNNVLDELGPDGKQIMWDVINYDDKNRYWNAAEEGEYYYFVHHKVRIVLPKP